MPIATKAGRVVTYHERLRSIRSYGLLTTWSCKITRQTKIIKTSLPEWLWSQNVAGWYVDDLLLIKSHDRFITGFARSLDQLKLFYLQYRSVCGHQTW